MVSNNEEIRRYFHENPIITKRTFANALIEIIQDNSSSDEIVRETLDLLLNIVFEGKVIISQSERLIIRNAYFFGTVLMILNTLFNISDKWQIEIKTILKYLIKTIEGSYINYSAISNVLSSNNTSKAFFISY